MNLLAPASVISIFQLDGQTPKCLTFCPIDILVNICVWCHYKPELALHCEIISYCFCGSTEAKNTSRHSVHEYWIKFWYFGCSLKRVLSLCGNLRGGVWSGILGKIGNKKTQETEMRLSLLLLFYNIFKRLSASQLENNNCNLEGIKNGQKLRWKLEVSWDHLGTVSEKRSKDFPLKKSVCDDVHT